MRLRSDADKLSLLSEVNRIDLLDSDEIPSSIFEELVETRRQLLEKMKDFRKSQTQKANWRRHRWKYLKGIKKFHRSTDGKKFHRTLARYLATRIVENFCQNRFESTIDDILTAVSSARTHLYIDLGYYKPLVEEVEYSELVEYYIPLLNSVELKLIESKVGHLTDEELEALLRLIDQEVVEEIFNIKLDELRLDEEFYILETIKSSLRSNNESTTAN